jgi:replicative DNA helicase
VPTPPRVDVVTDQPPANAEQAAVGAALLGAQALAEVVDVAAFEDFYRPAHTTILDAALHLAAQGGECDAGTVAAELQRRGELTRAGGAAHLHTLIDAVPAASPLYHAAAAQQW